ncbi:hypothetical protein [Christiangramia echinicola]|uniref:hypothetical protein n=1 Tax=Christiangramia echinicola TaxID=279359 RepID=UPI0003F99174|nr:hypothetical protein [Christiangramia echinicola]
MKRISGGEQNKKSGTKWTEEELLEVYQLYKRLGGEGLHENNPEIIKTAQDLGRTVRSTEAQTLMFRNLDRNGDYGMGNMNKICKKIWSRMEGANPINGGTLFNPDKDRNSDIVENNKNYPAGLLEWAGHRKGGVKKPFDQTGRPTGSVIYTQLTHKIEAWVNSLDSDSPRIILLIGGPGNGKTDALEHLISQIDIKYKSSYYQVISEKIQEAGNIAPRVVEIDLDENHFGKKKLKLVQDASTGKKGFTSGECLIDDIINAIEDNSVYIAGINRGILAEAVSKAEPNSKAYKVFNAIVQGLTQYLDPKSLWPLGEELPLKEIAVWPMDVESLVDLNDDFETTPGFQIINEAVSDKNWNCHECKAQDYCPFFQNKNRLSEKESALGLLQILRDYEVIANKRWSFRELFSLFSYILVGTEQEFNGYKTPCDWVENQTKGIFSTQNQTRIYSIWSLNEHLYHVRLFNKWPSFNSIRRANKRTNKEVADILNQSSITKHFFGYFAYKRPQKVNKPHITKLIDNSFFELMDPGQLSNEDEDFDKLELSVKKLESNFSYSIESGYESIKHILNPLEDLLYKYLIEIESQLDNEVRFEPSISSMRVEKILVILRAIASRYIKRIYFTSKGISKDEIFLQKYRTLNPGMDPTGNNLKRAKQLFDNLVQEQDGLEMVLNSSISQPQLDQETKICLRVGRLKIKNQYIKDHLKDVPRPKTKVFKIKFKKGYINVPLTYQLYKALYLVENGVRLSSLPSEVISMLDSIKSKMAGEIVRDHDLLENATLKIGSSKNYYRIDEAESEIEISTQN